jgi:hypothetical protein
MDSRFEPKELIVFDDTMRDVARESAAGPRRSELV